MKKVKFLYNPNAGNRRIQGSLDIVIRKFQEAGFIMSIYRSMSKGDMASHITFTHTSIYNEYLSKYE